MLISFSKLKHPIRTFKKNYQVSWWKILLATSLTVADTCKKFSCTLKVKQRKINQKN
jgi:hypothetical protein